MKIKLQVPPRPDDRSDIEFLSKQPLAESAIRLLVRAYDLARENNCDVWELSVSIQDFHAFGVPSTELIIPLKRGYIEHAHEQTRLGAAKRSFRGHVGSLLTDRSYFVLTKAGAALAERYLESSASRTQPIIPAGQATTTMVRRDSPHLAPPPPNLPHWDGSRRTLFLGDIVLRHFSRANSLQEIVVVSFHELRWVHRIDDPLPGKHGIDPRQRLHDTVKNLNRSLLRPLIHFFLHSGSRGVGWELSG